MQVERELVRLETEPQVATEHAEEVIHVAMPVLDREDDDYGKCRAWLLRGQLAWNAGRVGSADEAWREAAECADRAEDERELFEVIGWRAMAAAVGPTPVDEAIRRCQEFRERVRTSPLAVASTSTRWPCCTPWRVISRLPSGCSRRPARCSTSSAASAPAYLTWRRS